MSSQLLTNPLLSEAKYFIAPLSLLIDSDVHFVACLNRVMFYGIALHTIKHYGYLHNGGFTVDSFAGSASWHHVSFNNNEAAYQKAKALHEQQHSKVLISISTTLYLQFIEGEKTEFDIACFLAFTAIKSIKGTKRYVKTNKAHILARMCGFDSAKQIVKPNDFHKKYSTEYHWKKLLNALKTNWKVKLMSNHTRGYYVGIGNTITIKELFDVSEKAKQKNKLAAMKANEKLEIQAAKAELLKQ